MKSRTSQWRTSEWKERRTSKNEERRSERMQKESKFFTCCQMSSKESWAVSSPVSWTACSSLKMLPDGRISILAAWVNSVNGGGQVTVRCVNTWDRSSGEQVNDDEATFDFFSNSGELPSTLRVRSETWRSPSEPVSTRTMRWIWHSLGTLRYFFNWDDEESRTGEADEFQLTPLI